MQFFYARAKLSRGLKCIVPTDRNVQISSNSPILILQMIIMVGFPASGKSTFSRRQLSAYTRINRDELISWDKCKAKCKEVRLLKNLWGIGTVSSLIQSMFLRSEICQTSSFTSLLFQALQKGESVVVDNTNPDLSSRERWMTREKSKEIWFLVCNHFSIRFNPV